MDGGIGSQGADHVRGMTVAYYLYCKGVIEVIDICSCVRDQYLKPVWTLSKIQGDNLLARFLLCGTFLVRLYLNLKRNIMLLLPCS